MYASDKKLAVYCNYLTNLVLYYTKQTWVVYAALGSYQHVLAEKVTHHKDSFCVSKVLASGWKRQLS